MRELLRILWSEPRVPSAPPPGRRDALLLAGVFAVGAFELAVRPELSWQSPELLWAFVLLSTLFWRRSRPLAMVSLAFGASTIITLSTLLTARQLVPLNTQAFLLLLPYALFRWGSGREAMIGLPITLAAAISDFAVAPTVLGEVIGGIAILLSSMALGAAVRYRERAHERGIAQAKLHEREQLARDLHDTVAHHVSAIAIRAQAGLAVAETRPDAAADALRVIAAEASRTLAEMRAIVRVLRRDDAAELVPQPRVTDLAQLAQAPSEGLAIEVLLDGELAELPPAISSALYRLAQESITNARKHARRATRIVVGVRADEASVRLEVRDDGEPAEMGSSVRLGYGLVGMTERAELLGGTCTAGPLPQRGWTVTVVLPRTGPSP